MNRLILKASASLVSIGARAFSGTPPSTIPQSSHTIPQLLEPRQNSKFPTRRQISALRMKDCGSWLGGGKLGQRLVLWSLEKATEIRQFDCPDGAAAGIVVDGQRIWLPHRNNRKLFCLDTQDGKTRWVIRTEKETYSPASCDGELWLIECDPGPLGHWSHAEQAKYSFIRYDTVRERVAEHLPVSFVPSCMAFDGERFWYAEMNRKGFASISRKALTKS